MENETIEMDLDELKELEEDALFLHILLDRGVHTWYGYDEAYEQWLREKR